MKKDFIHLVYFTHEATGYEKEYFVEIKSNERTLSKSEATDELYKHVVRQNPNIKNMKKGFRIKGLHTLVND